jgi:hypothetical protein
MMSPPVSSMRPVAEGLVCPDELQQQDIQVLIADVSLTCMNQFATSKPQVAYSPAGCM